MKKILCALTIALISLPMAVQAEAVPGKPAPAFEVKDSTGKTQNLTAYKGKWVVLEWFNKDCPYVKKHYGSENMQKLQKTYTTKEVTWLTVVSSNKGKEGYLTPTEAVELVAKNKSAANAILIDENGAMGRAYGAKTTPHMFIINPEGKVAYAGAIDDNDSANPAVIAKSTNYVTAALDAGLAGKPIVKASTRAYGCSVKY